MPVRNSRIAEESTYHHFTFIHNTGAVSTDVDELVGKYMLKLKKNRRQLWQHW